MEGCLAPATCSSFMFYMIIHESQLIHGIDHHAHWCSRSYFVMLQERYNSPLALQYPEHYLVNGSIVVSKFHRQIITLDLQFMYILYI